MRTELYLDTARFGRMTPRSQAALRDFVRLCGAEGGSGRVIEFIRDGVGVRVGRLPGLADWRGLAGFKESLRAVAGAPPASDVLVSSRSGQLMRLAARALFRRCGRVLHTDLEWPGYLAILEAERGRVRREVECVPVREAVLRDGLGRDALVRALADAFRARRCEGLFLSAVSFEGVRLPVAELLRELRFGRGPRFVVVDGAQALGHLDPGLGEDPPDFYLAGCHKWLRAGQPLGLGFSPRAGSRGVLRTALGEMLDSGELDDPLLHLDRELRGEDAVPFGETVDLTCLFSAAAAAAAARDLPRPAEGLGTRIENAAAAAAAAAGTGWRPLAVDRPLRSGILLLEAERPETRSGPPGRVRAGFQRRGISLTTYPRGIIRLSMPEAPWAAPDLDRVRSALRRCS